MIVSASACMEPADVVDETRSMEAGPSAVELREQDSGLIFHRDWEAVTEVYERAAADARALDAAGLQRTREALHGRAVAQVRDIVNPTGDGGHVDTVCSGFLIREELAVTALHCSQNRGNAALGATATFHFGAWDSRVLDVNLYVKERVQALGGSAPTSEEIELARAWRCESQGLDDPATNGWGDLRDSMLWYCPAQRLGGVLIEPGQLWGWYTPTLFNAFHDGAALHVGGANLRSWIDTGGTGAELADALMTGPAPDGRVETLISDAGKVMRAPSRTQCAPFDRNNNNRLMVSDPNLVVFDDGDFFGDCFAHDSDMLGGSSGGPVVLDDTFEVLGIVQGEVAPGDRRDPQEWVSTGYRWDRPRFERKLVEQGVRSPFRAYGVATGNTVANMATTFGETYLRFALWPDIEHPLPVKGGSIDDAEVRNQDVAGRRTAWPEGIFCPGGGLPSGVMYTASARLRRMTSLFLVCPTYADGETTHQLTHAAVVGVGTPDTTHRGPQELSYQAAHNQLLQLDVPDRVHSYELLCPPGHYLSAVEFTAEDGLQHLTSIECIVPRSGNRPVVRRAVANMPYGTSGTTAPARTQCAEGTYAVGGVWYADETTQGFGLVCATADQ